LTEQICRFCPQAVVITATNPVDPLNYAMHRLCGGDRKKFLGYSLNDSFRFRLITSRLLG
jgi:malate/lactate dehydrogenase